MTIECLLLQAVLWNQDHFSLSHVYIITGSTSNPTIVGEVLSDVPAEQKVSIVVIARLLDADGNGVNDKSLSFSIDDEIEGEWDTQDPSTKYVPNFKEFGFPDLGGNGYAYARFTPSNGVNKLKLQHLLELLLQLNTQMILLTT